jgi:4-aminobutyrate aminotransferase-like enzyme
MVDARVVNARMETGFVGGLFPVTHTLYDINLFDSGNHKLYQGTTTQAWSFGSTLEAAVSGELPARKDYFVLITGSETNDTALAYAMKVSVISAVVPEPEAYAMFLAGLGLMGFIVRHKKRNM